MAKILIGGAGGAPSNNFIKSLKDAQLPATLIGMNSIAADLFLADVAERYIVPPAVDSTYESHLLALCERIKPQFVHAQHDFEVRAIGKLRDKLARLGVRTFLPSNDTIATCVDKSRSYQCFKAAGLRVPDTVLVRTENDLHHAMTQFGGKVWLRATEGGGGRGALPVDDLEFAKRWIDRFDGWGAFTAARMLSAQSVTWMSIWHAGKLVVAQTRRRRSWNFADRTLSGVTGVTGVGETMSDATVDEVALASIHAVDAAPHGIFSVDLTYDHDRLPNPTEINIGRFFTTHYFFTKAGINFPKIYCDLGMYDVHPMLAQRLNPLPNGLLWIRGMDVEPVLIRSEELAALEAAPK